MAAAFDEQDLSGAPGAATWVRYRVLGMLCALTFILYLDRICISQAATDIEEELDISHTTMGYVFGAFTLAYGLFEVPTGHWGDRFGSRGVLTRIVLWWSLFTVLTGLAPGLIVLLVVRFLFGAGEAGALPNAARVVARWFPPGARGPAQGVVITSALVGGAAAPVITQYLIDGLKWRGAFAALGIPGLLWAAVFYFWYRDNPAEHPAVNELERDYIRGGTTAPSLGDHGGGHFAVPWERVLTSANVWLLGTIVTCGAFTTYLFFTWYPTYLKKGREVDDDLAGWLSGMVLAGGAIGSTFGGYLSDWLILRTGNRRWSRRTIGFFAMAGAATGMVASIHCDSPWLAAAWATWACLSIHLYVASWWGTVTEISGKHLGALFGLMNSLGVPGAFISPLFMGWFVDWLKSHGYTGRDQWDPAFYVYAAVLGVGAVCWLFVDSTKSAVEEENQK